MTRITEISHPSHPGHVLKLGPPADPFRCNACKELGLGPRYSCENRACDFHLHEECGDPPQRRSHRLFPGCTFTLLEASTNRVCDACGKDVLGISYRCDHRDSRRAHDAHPCCLALPRHLCGGGGVHLRLSGKVSSRCNWCGTKEAARNVKGWSYVSDKGHCLHVACVKDMVLEKYKEGYFGQNYLSGLSWATTSNNNALAPTNSVFGKKTKVTFKIVTVVLKLIISAVFGNAAPGVSILIESLFS